MSAVRLGDHARLIRGITFKPVDKCDLRDEGSVVCMRTKNVQAALDESDLIAVPSSLVKNAEKMLSAGDILVSSANSWNHVGKCCQVPKLEYPSTAGGFISILRPKTEQLESSYLFRWFSSDVVQRKLRSFANQTTNISNLNHKRTLDLQIPLPPLAEQKRIARILDAADALRAKRREALARLDALLQSTFLDIFGDPVVNPMRWPPTTLSAISEEFKDGPFGSNLKTSHYVEKGVRVIRLQNIGVGEMLNDDRAFISEEHFASLPRNHCTPGDVIIGTMGDPNLRACIVPAALQRALNKADCILMRVDMSKVDANYVCWLLNNPGIVSMALRLVRGQTRGRISLGRLKSLQIYLPPIDLQHRFAAIVEAVEQQRASQRAHLAELDTLFASLQSRAFRGDL